MGIRIKGNSFMLDVTIDNKRQRLAEVKINNYGDNLFPLQFQVPQRQLLLAHGLSWLAMY